jgi:transcriptional regulator with XRE-family HTH domain
MPVSLSASEIDRVVGQRMRQRRESLGISQGRLGRHLGLTFSQIQKYEKGANRIGAGRLYQISKYLSVKPSYFFEDLENNGSEALQTTGGSRDEVRTLTEAFITIPDKETRASVLALVRSLTVSPQEGRIVR